MFQYKLDIYTIIFQILKLHSEIYTNRESC